MDTLTPAQIAGLRKRRAGMLKMAQLSSGVKKGGKSGTVDATLARFWTPKRHVPDFEFVEDDSAELIRDAQRRVIWAHRLVSRQPPFAEALAHLEWALARLDPLAVTRMRTMEKQRQADEERRALIERQKAESYQRLYEPPTKPPLVRKKRRPSKVDEFAEVKRLKKRTREQRIGDLQRALERQ